MLSVFLCLLFFFLFFFFFFFFFFSSRRRHTRFSRDWSSDVCSSDLRQLNVTSPTAANTAAMFATVGDVTLSCLARVEVEFAPRNEKRLPWGRSPAGLEIGRASCRERGWVGVGVGGVRGEGGGVTRGA